MTWEVGFTGKAAKATAKLPERFQAILETLVLDIKEKGPVRVEWPNYSKLGPRRHHCHLKKRSKPTYVAVWAERNGKCRIVEITYAGTLENAPY